MKIDGYMNLERRYFEAIPSNRSNTTTCGLPRSDAFHVFQDPVTGDQPWPGLVLQASLGCLWYWCCDQVPFFFCILFILFPDMPILGSSNSAANKDMMSKTLTNGNTIFRMSRKNCGERRNCSFRAISSFPPMFLKAVCC